MTTLNGNFQNQTPSKFTQNHVENLRLGIIGKSSDISTQEYIDFCNKIRNLHEKEVKKENLTFHEDSYAHNHIYSSSQQQKNRSIRFKLLKTIQKVLIEEGLNKGLTEPYKFHSTISCRVNPTAHKTPELNYGISQKKAFYGNIQHCENVWVCPCCAVKAQEERRNQIHMASEWVYHAGLQAVMVTLTFPHTGDMSLKECLEKQTIALKKFRESYFFKKLPENYNYQGLIRALEIMVSQRNGWHPHTHELWFINSFEKIEEEERKKVEKKFSEDLNAAWKTSCIKAGLLDEANLKQLTAFNAHSVDIAFNCKSTEYLTKTDPSLNFQITADDEDKKQRWGVDKELSSGVKKMQEKGKKKSEKSGRHPFELVSEMAEEIHLPSEERSYKFSKNKALFLEYVEAMKGKAFIFWSRNLKKTIGIDEDNEENTLLNDETDSVKIMDFTRGEWRDGVIKKDLYLKLLNVVESAMYRGVSPDLDEKHKLDFSVSVELAKQWAHEIFWGAMELTLKQKMETYEEIFTAMEAILPPEKYNDNLLKTLQDLKDIVREKKEKEEAEKKKQKEKNKKQNLSLSLFNDAAGTE